MLARKILNLEKRYETILEKAREEAESILKEANKEANKILAEPVDFSEQRIQDEKTREEIAKTMENDVQEFRVKDDLVEEIVRGVQDL